jgi:hypothetical protein
MRIKQMTNQKTLLILWIIYGFVFIQAVDSVLFFLSHLAYFATVGLGVPYSILNFVLPCITISLYLATAYLFLKKAGTESQESGILFTKFPKRQLIILFVLAITVIPLTNRLRGLFAEFNPEIHNQTPTEFLAFYGWFHFGIGFARWTTLVILALIYMKKYGLTIIKN